MEWQSTRVRAVDTRGSARQVKVWPGNVAGALQCRATSGGDGSSKEHGGDHETERNDEARGDADCQRAPRPDVDRPKGIAAVSVIVVAVRLTVVVRAVGLVDDVARMMAAVRPGVGDIVGARLVTHLGRAHRAERPSAAILAPDRGRRT